MSKYKNIKTNGCDSKKEAQRYEELLRMEREGIITDLQRQVKFVLIPSQRYEGKVIERECTYKADFVYIQNGEKIVEDVKPFNKRTGKYIVQPEYVIKRKLMLERMGIRIKQI